MKYLCFLILIIFSLTACQKGKSPFPSGEAKIVPNQQVENFTLAETREGKKNWVLTAKEAKSFEQRKEIELKELRLDFYRGESEEHYSTLTAEKGKVNVQTNDMTAYGNVIVISAKGEKLETQSLNWLNGPQKIVTEDFIRLTKAEDVVSGQGLEADPDLKNIIIKKKFYGKKKFPSKDIIP
ncbi:MAG: LPS export ABC transporter periplasmic protein LptC [Candidatus Edwardsbacteria bacterium]